MLLVAGECGCQAILKQYLELCAALLPVSLANVVLLLAAFVFFELPAKKNKNIIFVFFSRFEKKRFFFLLLHLFYPAPSLPHPMLPSQFRHRDSSPGRSGESRVS